MGHEAKSFEVKINRKVFADLKRELKKSDSKREQIIRYSRETIRLSKQVISALHRGETKKANSAVKSMKRVMASLSKIADSKAAWQGSFKAAAQEYSEAMCYLWFVQKGTIPGHKELKVDAEHFVLGLCDFVGELVRRAVNQGIEGNSEEALRIYRFAQNIYNELMELDVYGGEIRKKIDGVKWDIKRLEEMAFALSVKARTQGFES